MLASEAVAGFLWVIAGVVALAALYWESPWPVALGAAYVALVALDIARGAGRHSSLLWAVSQPARPMRMQWSLSVVLTERAWDTLGVPAEERAGLQEVFGEYKPPGLTSYLFQGHPTPAWISLPVTVSYERWGESLERWPLWNCWASEGLRSMKHHEKRVLEFLPAAFGKLSLDLWGDWKGPRFCYEDGRFIFLNMD